MLGNAFENGIETLLWSEELLALGVSHTLHIFLSSQTWSLAQEGTGMPSSGTGMRPISPDLHLFRITC